MRRFAKPLYWLIPVPRVRIPPSPPPSLSRTEIGLRHGKNRWKSPQFYRLCLQTGPEKLSGRVRHLPFLAFFSARYIRSPVSATSIRRM